MVAASGDEFKSSSQNNMGFVLRKAASESAAQQDLEKIIERGLCIIDLLQSDDFFVSVSDPSTWSLNRKGHIIVPEAAGLYSLIFARCQPSGSFQVNFSLEAMFFNPGPNYLSAGDAPLPVLYLSFFVLFSAAFVAWAGVLRYSAGTVHRIHYMMLALVGLKSLTLLFEGIRFHFIAINGSSEG